MASAAKKSVQCRVICHVIHITTPLKFLVAEYDFSQARQFIQYTNPND